MSVEITGLPDRRVQNTGDNQQVASKGKAQGGDTATKAASGSDDKVSLTSSATRLQDLATQVSQLPVVDTGVVNEVQRTLATGSFQFEPVQAADNLLTQEKELATLDVQK